MLTPLPAASLTACLASSPSLLYCKLWRGGRKGLRWAQEHARPSRPTGGRGRAVLAAHDAGRHCVDVEKWGRACACAFVSECGKVLWAKQGMCSESETCALSDAGESVQRKGRKSVRFCVSGRWHKSKHSWAAAHLSSLSTPFSLMQLAMMMADMTPMLLLERSIFSVGFVPLSWSI